MKVLRSLRLIGLSSTRRTEIWSEDEGKGWPFVFDEALVVDERGGGLGGDDGVGDKDMFSVFSTRGVVVSLALGLSTVVVVEEDRSGGWQLLSGWIVKLNVELSEQEDGL